MPNIVKNTTFINPLDLLAPHSCRGCGRIGNVLCNRCKNNIIESYHNICPVCKSNNPTGKCQNCKDQPTTYVIGERSDLLGTLIHDLKYHSVRAIYKPLAEILNSTLPQIKGDVIIVPLPTSKKHIRTRGLDHTYLIAKHFAKLRGKNYQVQRILLRTKDTVQVGTDQKTRVKQAASAYQLNPKIPLNKKATYLLLDDVWTTGATMQAAIKRLREFGARQSKINLAILALSRIN